MANMSAKDYDKVVENTRQIKNDELEIKQINNKILASKKEIDRLNEKKKNDNKEFTKDDQKALDAAKKINAKEKENLKIKKEGLAVTKANNDKLKLGNELLEMEYKSYDKIWKTAIGIDKVEERRTAHMRRIGEIALMEEQGKYKIAATMREINNLETQLLGLKTSQQILNYDAEAALESIKHHEQQIIKELETATGKDKVRLELLIKQLEKQKGFVNIQKKITENAKAHKKVVDKLKASTLNIYATLKGWVLVAKQFLKLMLANPLVLMGAAIGILITQLVGAVKHGIELQDSMGLSAAGAKNMTEEMYLMNKGLEKLGLNGTATSKALVDNFGKTSTVTKENVYNISIMQRTLGMAAEDTTKFAKSFTSLTGLTMDSALNMAEFAGSLAMANDVAPGAVMADIASSTEEFAAFGKDGGKNIVEAAVAARQLGLELKTLTRISDSLLDFESSIAAEMEASMLIGKQLNYNKARELALQGDIAGAAQDVMKQVGGAAEFQRMNVIQRRKLAASIGVSVEEMSKLASGTLEIKDKKSATEELNDKMKELIPGIGTLEKSMTALKWAVIALTTAMALKAGSDLLGRWRGKGPRGGPKGPRTQTGLRNDGKWDRRTNVGRKNYNMDIRNKSFDKLNKINNKPGFFSRMGDKVRGLKMPSMPSMPSSLSGAWDATKAFGKSAFSMKNMKGLLSKGKFSLGGLAAGLLIDPIKDAFTEEGSVVNKMLSVADKTATYAGYGGLGGAAVGSVVPVAGNISAGTIGAIGGGITGFGLGMWEEFGGPLKDWWSGESKTVEAASKANEEVIKKVAQVVQTGPMQGPPLPPAELISVQKDQQAIEEKKQKFLEEEKKKQDEERKIQEQKQAAEAQRAANIAAEKALLEAVKVTQTDTGTGANRVRTKTVTDTGGIASSKAELEAQIALQRKSIATNQRLYDSKYAQVMEDGRMSSSEKRSLGWREEKIEKGQKRLEELLAQLVVVTENVGKDVAKEVINNA